MPSEGQGVHHLHGAPLHPVRPLAAGDVEQPREGGGGSIAHRGPQTGKLGPRVRRRTETDGVKVNQGYLLLKSLNISHCVFGITRFHTASCQCHLQKIPSLKDQHRREAGISIAGEVISSTLGS